MTDLEKKVYSREYSIKYRAENREKCNKLSRECMRRKRAKDRENRLQNQRDNPKEPLFIKKAMHTIKGILR